MFPIIPANSVAAASGNDEGIFGFGNTGSPTGVTNLVSNAGVVATDTAGVGTARYSPAACEYGGDKGIFGFGGNYITSSTTFSTTNLVSNAGVVATDTAGVGTARYYLSACGYGEDKGIFGFGKTESPATLHGVTNLVSNTGVVATDTAGVGTARYYQAACEYGGDKGIFGYGDVTTGGGGLVGYTNLVSNAGVVATDTAGVGSARKALAACEYGGDKGIFGFGTTGSMVSISNLVSNAGVVATDTAGVGTVRQDIAACGYGGDKGIFGFGYGASFESMTNLVSNTGVVATDTAGVGTATNNRAACSFN